MNLLNIFGSGDEKRRSHVKNLITVAMADGHLAKEEWDLLVIIARKLGMNNEDIQSIKDNPEDVKFTPPKKYDEKIQQVEDLVSVMMIDGDVDKNEMELCKKLALKLDLLPRVINDLIYQTYKKRITHR
ncbi:TerB family tellurite resistance protein [Fulvivirga sediminis]|uniref:TerB family tellurite resistance protein n=1 Tax=Fulvivirga sediminis TaxID=2803949 RepID=A0A937FAA6_9BACT|nr:TerB family tellurite resistance protein [Fulvivirga sediminis]MBL3656908.1 TerB family tellurite resistance protein [Fulvivirga sediminis]